VIQTARRPMAHLGLLDFATAERSPAPGQAELILGYVREASMGTTRLYGSVMTITLTACAPTRRERRTGPTLELEAGNAKGSSSA
jgi:hypothetical protein